MADHLLITSSFHFVCFQFHDKWLRINIRPVALHLGHEFGSVRFGLVCFW